MWTY